MAYDLKTVDDIRRRLKQAPGDLKIMTFDDGLCYPIDRIESCYVIPTKNWNGEECYTTADENQKGAFQIMLIE